MAYLKSKRARNSPHKNNTVNKFPDEWQKVILRSTIKTIFRFFQIEDAFWGCDQKHFQIENIAECKCSKNARINSESTRPHCDDLCIQYLPFENLLSHCHFVW